MATQPTEYDFEDLGLIIGSVGRRIEDWKERDRKERKKDLVVSGQLCHFLGQGQGYKIHFNNLTLQTPLSSKKGKKKKTKKNQNQEL